MASWQNGKLAKWQVGNGKSSNCQVGKMPCWLNFKFAKWQVGLMVRWPNDLVPSKKV